MNDQIKLSIFTPVYNRAKLIKRVFNSLRKQETKTGFEWIIVDDGSTDNVEEVVEEFKLDSSFPISYIKQKNGGKHRAINRGVKLAKGELFLIVDSDDYLTTDAVSFIFSAYKGLKGEEGFAGFAALRAYPNGIPIVHKYFDTLDCSILDFRYKRKVNGDLAEVFFTNVLKQYPFPSIEGETFCSESLVWNRLGNKYCFRFFYKSIYICDYLEGGLSDNSLLLRTSNPNYARLNAYELGLYNIPFLEKIKAYINFWRFSYHVKHNKLSRIKPVMTSYIFAPVGYLFYLLDKNKISC